MQRRQFLGAAGALPFVLSATQSLFSEEKSAMDFHPESVLDSYPVLQNPAEDSVCIAWCVKALANGWVEWGNSPDALNHHADGAVYGLRPLSDSILSVRLTGLKPNTQYFYRVACKKVHFPDAYHVTTDEPEYSAVYTFQTPGPEAKKTSFSVLNDTHQNANALRLLTAKLAELNADYTVWAGDLTNNVEDLSILPTAIMRPANAPFAAEKPLLFARGNHDHRGKLARELSRYFTPWEHPEFAFRGLGYSGVVRHGDLAMILLDTGEDKPDFRREWAGLASFEPYIRLQGEWLAQAVQTRAVQTAPFVVVFTHIPLFDDRPDANPGTLETGYSSWKKLALDCWGDSLRKAGVPLVISGHLHDARVYPADADRGWTQITGGGPVGNPTVIHGLVQDGRLTVTTYNVQSGKVLSTLEFSPRKVSAEG